MRMNAEFVQQVSRDNATATSSRRMTTDNTVCFPTSSVPRASNRRTFVQQHTERVPEFVRGFIS